MISGTSGAAEYAMTEVLEGRDVTWGGLRNSFLTGVAFGALGPVVAKGLAKCMPWVKLAAAKVKDSISQMGKKISGMQMGPQVVTPESVVMRIDSSKVGDDAALPRTETQQRYLDEMERLEREAAAKTGKGNVQLGKEELDALRKKWNVPETDQLPLVKRM